MTDKIETPNPEIKDKPQDGLLRGRDWDQHVTFNGLTLAFRDENLI